MKRIFCSTNLEVNATPTFYDRFKFYRASPIRIHLIWIACEWKYVSLLFPTDGNKLKNFGSTNKTENADEKKKLVLKIPQVFLNMKTTDMKFIFEIWFIWTFDISFDLIYTKVHKINRWKNEKPKNSARKKEQIDNNNNKIKKRNRTDWSK